MLKSGMDFIQTLSATVEILFCCCALGHAVVGTRGNDEPVDAIGELVITRNGSLILALEFLSLATHCHEH